MIHAFSHIEGARDRAGADVGPFARLRPGAEHRRKAPRSAISSRSRAAEHRRGRQGQPPHLYRRRRASAPSANIGAGTITCNYDGFFKYRPRSARAPSSAPTRRWSRRSRSATAPMSAPARSSPRTCPPTRWPSARGPAGRQGRLGERASARAASRRQGSGAEVKPINPATCEVDVHILIIRCD